MECAEENNRTIRATSKKARVILAGGGHAHLAVLEDWIRQPLDDTERWLITSSPGTAYSGMLPGWMAGHYRAGDLFIDLRPLAARAGIKLVIGEIVGLDANAKSLTLSGGDIVAFDLLSLATGGETDISTLAALGEKLLPVRPVADFMERWSRVAGLAGHRATNVAIVGGGAAGVELALAAAASLRRQVANARICLVTPEDCLLAGHAPTVREKALAELSKGGVSLHFAHAVGDETGLLLSNGDFLAVDCVIAATGTRAPRWLAGSGLACDSRGFVAVGSDLRSASHPAIFAAGDIVDRIDRDLERSGVHAVKAGPVLAFNLRASLAGAGLRHYCPRKRTLYLLATGDRRAILSWGSLSTAGKLAWRLKDWVDRNFVGRYSEPTRTTRRARRAMPKLLSIMLSRPVVANAIRVSLFVGTCLNAINQGPAIWHGEPIEWGKFLLNFAVPYLVASYSAAKARKAMVG